MGRASNSSGLNVFQRFGDLPCGIGNGVADGHSVLMFAATLVFALAAGTVTLLTVQPQWDLAGEQHAESRIRFQQPLKGLCTGRRNVFTVIND